MLQGSANMMELTEKRTHVIFCHMSLMSDLVLFFFLIFNFFFFCFISVLALQLAVLQLVLMIL